MVRYGYAGSCATSCGTPAELRRASKNEQKKKAPIARSRPDLEAKKARFSRRRLCDLWARQHRRRKRSPEEPPPRSGSRSPAAQDQSTESLQPLQERAQSGAQRLETLESIRESGRIEERAQDAKTAAHVESCRALPPELLLRSASQRSGAGILSGHILRAPGRPSSSSELQPVFSASF